MQSRNLMQYFSHIIFPTELTGIEYLLSGEHEVAFIFLTSCIKQQAAEFIRLQNF